MHKRLFLLSVVFIAAGCMNVGNEAIVPGLIKHGPPEPESDGLPNGRLSPVATLLDNGTQLPNTYPGLELLNQQVGNGLDPDLAHQKIIGLSRTVWRNGVAHTIQFQYIDAPVEGIPDIVAEERKEEQEVLDHMKQTLKESLNIAASADILTGETADVIAQACRQFDADEVIVPSHARHGFSRLWFGSVADEIVDAAPCTVVVLKMPHGTKR